MQIVLASQSPRRQALLTGMGIFDFIVCPATGEEVAPPGLQPYQLVEALALEKAREVQKKYPQDLIIGADTVVVLDDCILGKPRDRAEAAEMLARLSGRAHQVYTGVALCRTDQTHIFHQMTTVEFRPLSQREMIAYLATGDSMDKAGAYGIQDQGALFVKRISGDYFNVMGLPVCQLGQALLAFQIEVLAPPEQWETQG